jgi:hypothetical protein
MERTKSALIDAQELSPHAEKLAAFDVSAHMPERVVLLGGSDYDDEYRMMEEFVNKRSDIVRRDVVEKYGSFVGKLECRDSGGAIFNFVKEKGNHIRIILLRKPLDMQVLVHEILHIFEDYLNLQYGDLTRFVQSLTRRINIRTQ